MDVEIWSDIACPWCYIGKRRFETALAQFPAADQVSVTWRSFELDPAAPPERSGDLAAHLAKKYGMTLAQAQASQQHLVQQAAGEGLEFRFDRARSGSTFDAHRVVHLAREHGLQDAVKERLLRGYFSEGELMSDDEALIRLAADAGLPAQEVREMLAGERYSEQVREDERIAQSLGITAVPTFVVDRALGGSGAHPPAALLELLDRGWKRRAPVQVLAGGESCGVDGC
ncbi:MAG: DsbA family oxidoreductase [Solirubrobacteraceae bacterium]